MTMPGPAIGVVIGHFAGLIGCVTFTMWHFSRMSDAEFAAFPIWLGLLEGVAVWFVIIVITVAICSREEKP